MDFIVTITDQAQLDGITWVREQYNAAIPPGEDGTPSTPPLDSDEAYVNHVMSEAAASYAQQKTDAAWRDAYETSKARGESLPTGV